MIVLIPSGSISRRKSFLDLLVPRDRQSTAHGQGPVGYQPVPGQPSRTTSVARSGRSAFPRLLFHPGLGFLRSVTHAEYGIINTFVTNNSQITVSIVSSLQYYLQIIRMYLHHMFISYQRILLNNMTNQQSSHSNNISIFVII